LSLHDLKVRTLSGDLTTLGEVTGGKAALVVNVASKCGLTPQYTELEQLHAELPGLTVVGVPCNQFGGQEPGSAEEIAQFCSATYGVTFPMLEKSDVNGPDRSELFDALTAAADAEGKAGDVTWNFEKWLVSKDGEVVGRFRPQVTPSDPALREAVQQVL
jgi:glutathione peroxidase